MIKGLLSWCNFKNGLQSLLVAVLCSGMQLLIPETSFETAEKVLLLSQQCSMRHVQYAPKRNVYCGQRVQRELKFALFMLSIREQGRCQQNGEKHKRNSWDICSYRLEQYGYEYDNFQNDVIPGDKDWCHHKQQTN